LNNDEAAHDAAVWLHDQVQQPVNNGKLRDRSLLGTARRARRPRSIQDNEKEIQKLVRQRQGWSDSGAADAHSFRIRAEVAGDRAYGGGDQRMIRS